MSLLRSQNAGQTGQNDCARPNSLLRLYYFRGAGDQAEFSTFACVSFAERVRPRLVSVAKKASGFGFRLEQIFLNHLKPKFLCEPVKWDGPLSV